MRLEVSIEVSDLCGRIITLWQAGFCRSERRGMSNLVCRCLIILTSSWTVRTATFKKKFGQNNRHSRKGLH
ncbi:TPA: hypothetical protein ACH3X1_016198 [Trebouxia sp. C0004]